MMKLLLFSLFSVLVLAIASVAQRRPTQPPSKAPSAPPTALVSDKSSVAESDEQVLMQFREARNALFSCHNDFWTGWKDRPREDTTAREKLLLCEREQKKEVASAYRKISERAAAVQLLIGEDMSSYYQDFRSGLEIGGKSRGEMNAERQTDYQRLLVAQNARIIELLEQLLKRKP